jgi:hypothetical protein
MLTEIGALRLTLIIWNIVESGAKHHKTNSQAYVLSIESLSLEVTSDKQKWLFLGVYKPPSIRDNIFTDDFNKRTDKIVKIYDNFIIMGDINFNMLDDVNYVALRDLNFY